MISQTASGLTVDEGVLLVEPEPLTCWSLATYLSRWFTVRTAASRAAALRVADAEPVQAMIISDRISPDTTRSIVRAIRESHEDAKAIVMVSGDTTPPGLCDATHVEKPFELAHVARLLGVSDSEAISV